MVAKPATQSGMSFRQANMVFDVYDRNRRMGRWRNRGHATMAGGWVRLCEGCPQGLPMPIKGESEGGRPRHYVSDITLQVDMGTTGWCAERMRAQLERPKHAATRDNMVLNNGKQQVLGPDCGGVTRLGTCGGRRHYSEAKDVGSGR